jgi:vancomycin resistance protein YoaR
MLGVFRRHSTTIIGYGFILVSALTIGSIGYGTYAFGKYHNRILPGVYVSSLDIGSNTGIDAEVMIDDRLIAMHQIPITFTYGGHRWTPTRYELQLTYDVPTTVDNAYSIGRTGDFWQNLIDRLPLRRHFNVALLASYSKESATSWIASKIAPIVRRPMVSAGLRVVGSRVVLQLSQSGLEVDQASALRDIEATMGSLNRKRMALPVFTVPPQISDATAAAQARRINTFLAHPPTLLIGRVKLKTSAPALASAIRFASTADPSATSVAMHIDPIRVSDYIAGLLQSSYDIAPQERQEHFDGKNVSLVSSGRAGRSANQAAAASQVLKEFTTPAAYQTLVVPAHKVPPPVDENNPASLGVSTFLGQGETSFAGSGAVRARDIQNIAAMFNGILVKPGADISFNYYAGLGQVTGTGWPARVYDDTEQALNGSAVPGGGGAMDQVATTFFRAGYAAGLTLLERHAHTQRLWWYQPPQGLDAIVSQTGSDLRFQNDTGGYLWIQTRFDPVQQRLYVYVYGRNTGWTVNISRPAVSHVTAPGKPTFVPDTSLAQDTRRRLRFAVAGDEVTITRTVTTSGQSPHASTDTLVTRYQPLAGAFLVGERVRLPATTPTPLPTNAPTPTPTATTQPTASPTATPTP